MRKKAAMELSIGTIVVIVAVILAIVANVFIHPQQISPHMVMIHRVFDMMLPVLAIGALLKFLFAPICKKESCESERKED